MNTILLIDAGNTSIKVGVIENDTLQKVSRFDSSERDDYLKYVTSFDNTFGVISSVLSDEETVELTNAFKNYLKVDSSTPIPISSEYNTPMTLGIDRICNACFTMNRVKSGVGVSIDIGTCIKFDVVDSEGVYLGGSISPGINLRYQSLNDYTGKLPLVSNKSRVHLVGTDTETSIRSGVINGIANELNGFIASYRNQFDDLTFFVTGGDAKNFDLDSKNDIFADENLTLLGLYEIYKHNA